LEPENDTGRYRLQERITPDSDVWIAEDLEDPTAPVVVKVLPEGSDAIAARHLTELLGNPDLSSLNLPKDEGELPDGKPFVVFPYLQGPTLRVFLNSSGPLPFALAGRLLQQIGAGLGALHSHRIEYGVLSPEHVIVQHARTHPAAVLLNPGIYRVTGQTSESPGYLAPEQLAGRGTSSSDVYSLGVLAAEMLTGRRAFRYGSITELQKLQRIGLARGSLRKLRSKIPIRVEEEIRRATSWDPAHRPSDAEILGAKLAEFLGASTGVPKRRLVLAGLVGLALTALGLRRCGRLPR
jgi:eukaryotic-like serine/threonine-protein kinase